MLNCENLSISRNGITLAANISFAVESGDVVLLEGSNGSGKTTLLRTLAGLLRPAAGTVRWEEAPIRDNDHFYASMLYVGHANALKPELTVWQNVAFRANVKSGHAMLVPAALHFFGLQPFAGMPVRRLSAGWQRKTALACLLAIPSTLWLLDEPFSHLDTVSQNLVYDLINLRAGQGGGVVLTAHGIGEWPGAKHLRMDDFPPEDM